jgi:lauroyl/myristoyl acyltransferase
MSDPYRKLISLSDFAIASLLTILGILTTVLPEKNWSMSTKAFGRLVCRLPLHKLRHDAAQLQNAFPRNPKLIDSDEALSEKVANKLDDYMCVMDQNLLEKWHPQINVFGADRIFQSLRSGNGVVLWITPFAHSDLISKMGLAQEGILANHLSRPSHGFSYTRFGIATLNKLRTRVEDRYIQRRILIDYGSEKSAMLEMQHELGNNQIVSITVGARARRPAIVDIGSARCRIAVGAIILSQKTGAALLPVFPVADDCGGFDVTIEAAIDTQGVKIETALQSYAAMLAKYAGERPTHWRGIADCLDKEQ